MAVKSLVEKALDKGQGILRLTPTWVPRSFCRPAKRIKLHPDDYYKLGLERGGIDERWLASTTPADNGPGTPFDEGLSYIAVDEDGKEQVLLSEAVDLLGRDILGDPIWDKYGKWPMFSKFFDNMGPLPHHIHHRDEHAANVGEAGKPEMYFFPSQMNNHGGEFPFTFFGFNPGTTKEQVRECLVNFPKGDNKILDLSRSYKLVLDTGWDVPPGILHAPGTLCTYEPQFASDVYSMYQSVLYGGQCVSEELLWKDTPEDRIGDHDYLIELMDWELNVDPNFYENRFMPPVAVDDLEEMQKEGYIDEWICYKCENVSAKRLTVLPGREVVIKDDCPYGMILIQGYGQFGSFEMETPTLINFGQLTNDEFFVTYEAARKGVRIVNRSKTEPVVILKHYSDNPSLKI